MGEPIIDLLETEWQAMAELAVDFTDDDWATATELPGWSVKDCYSHVAGTEQVLRGETPPEVDLSGLEHLTAPSAPFTEPAVATRRPLSGRAVLDELVAVATLRIAELRMLPAERWDAVGPTPVGQATYREFMNVRAFDSWMHEQDVRRALGRPGHDDGPVTEHAIGRCAKSLGFVVGKKAGAADGTAVVFDISGPRSRTLVVTVEGGRASVVEDGPAPDPTVLLGLDQETLWCLSGGRWDPESVLDEGRVEISGDRPLGELIVRSMNIMI